MENPCSIFVGSLAIETSKETLQEYFGRFGAIESAVVLVDPGTSRSRGFGFVNFSSRDARDSALSSGPHFVDNKQVECKVAVRKGDMKPDMGGAGGGGRGRSDQFSESQEKKVFLGGISNGTTNEEIESALTRFGTVVGVEIKFDKVTQRMRGFGFVEFSSPAEATKAVSSQFIQINNKTVEIKLAQNRQTVPYGSPGGFGGTFANSMGLYGQPMAYGSYNTYPSNTTAGFNSGGASYMGSTPGYGSSPGYGSNSQYQNYGSKEASSPYGSTYSSGFSGNTSSTYGGSTASNFGGGSGGYGRGAYNPYSQ